MPNFEKKCGRYEVFEDRVARTGRKIDLNIVVLPATGSNPLPDPVFFFAGGPGLGAATIAGPMGTIGIDRDLVFIDQRGTGHSNPLNCPAFDDPSNLQAFFGELYPLDQMRRCRERLEKLADLRLYTTSIAMEDIDEVREALGYDQINLYGISYGTQAALVYLRAHPKHVRAVLLEGVAPPNTRVPLQFARGAQAALDSTFTDCEADPICHQEFPKLKKDFNAVLRRFDRGPITFEMTNPVTEAKEPVSMARGNFVVRLLSLLYSPGSAARVPFLLHKAFENDYEPLAIAALRANPGTSVARGVYFAITCSESVPFMTEKEIVRETKGTFLGDYRTRSHVMACKEWPRGNVSPTFMEPVKSDRPVLMISGLIDAATPYWLGKSAVRFLTKGRQLLVKNTGHAFGHPCIQSIAEDFIRKASVTEIDTTCIEDIARPPFSTN